VFPALFDDLLLDFRHSPAIDNVVCASDQDVYRQLNSHRQLIYRIAHGIAEIVEFLSIHSPVQGSTDVGTE